MIVVLDGIVEPLEGNIVGVVVNQPPHGGDRFFVFSQSLITVRKSAHGVGGGGFSTNDLLPHSSTLGQSSLVKLKLCYRAKKVEFRGVVFCRVQIMRGLLKISVAGVEVAGEEIQS